MNDWLAQASSPTPLRAWTQLLPAALALAVSLSSCANTEALLGEDVDGGARYIAEMDAPAAPYAWRLPAGFPEPPVPEDNPMTREKVELGRFLFYDSKLSGNGEQSCATCHEQRLAFSDGLALPEGSTGDVVSRNSPGLANVAYVSTYTWVNPLLLTLEEQIPVPLFGEFPTELGAANHEAEILGRLRNSQLYVELFAAAFSDLKGELYTFPNIVKALASFCRTLISGDSPYDRYVLGGDSEAISESAKRGLAMFFDEQLECHHCHNGFNLSNAVRSKQSRFDELAFFNTGLYNLGRDGQYPAGGEGLFEFTGSAADHGKFRTPSLRNISLTAPYMHDGSIETLEEVLRIYAAGGRETTDGPRKGDGRDNPNKDGFVHGFQLTTDEFQDMMAFFQSLTDQTFITEPRFSDPFDGG